MLDQLSTIQVVSIFVIPVIVLLGALFGPEKLRRPLWGGLVILLTTYFIRLF
ncbi:hypothetical protein F971_00106 [Acinetobacter vivianii]|uniref:Uncharacterized protein n=1 Tax=Acinetobacter vivianii TaxID=1776742 RepID=N8WG50_9GAMM|nr:hypothetical protein F971_00106 [Acinetobacter vivianii]